MLSTSITSSGSNGMGGGTIFGADMIPLNVLRASVLSSVQTNENEERRTSIEQDAFRGARDGVLG